jgi:ubiquinone/menaquinone biosynthesis C-methylase UbiE
VDVADHTVIKERQQQVWAPGDYATGGNTLVPVSELLCEAVDVRAGQKVLDVATRSGNTTLAAARRWCEVTGIDYVPALLQRGEARAAAEGLSVTFQEGDAEELPFPDRAFDSVFSTFGSMSAPHQE